MPVFENIVTLLGQHNIPFKLTEHVPVISSLEASRIRNVPLDMGAKALIFNADGSHILIVVPGDKKVDVVKFRKCFNFKTVTLVNKKIVPELFKVPIGGVPPLGKVLGIPSYFAIEFKSKDTIVFNPGVRSKSLFMSSKDLIILEDPLFGDFTK